MCFPAAQNLISLSDDDNFVEKKTTHFNVLTKEDT